MPNWCNNVVKIKATNGLARAELAELKARLRADDSGLHLMETFVPMPAEYEGTVEGTHRVAADDGLTWYEWQHRHWGVKWGDCKGEVLADSPMLDELLVRFDTPWGPPVPGLERISELFPNLLLEVQWDEESSQDSRGTFALRGGVLLDDEPEFDELLARYATVCECNGGPPCDCPDCEWHPDCVYKDASSDALTS